jgi:nicotinate-nucleotide adenylyltransferase
MALRNHARAVAPIGVLGGMFDPVHIGHLRTALEVLTSCQLSSVRFVPCGAPPHRAAPVAAAPLRLQMLRSALAAEPRFLIDERELTRTGPSYTVDTLASLRVEFSDVPLCLVLGADAFLGLPEWHRWQELTDLAHLIVVHRPGWSLPASGAMAGIIAQRRAAGPAALRDRPAGLIFTQPVTQLEISSSAVRALIASGGDPRFLVPDPVRDIILSSGCYGGRTAGGLSSAEVRVRA